MTATRALAPVLRMHTDPARVASVGVVFPGDPSAPQTWSGTPRGVLEGLRTAGAQAHPLTATPPERRHALQWNAVALTALPRVAGADGLTSRLRLSRAVARNTPVLSRTYTRAARRAVHRAPELDGLVQIGTGYGLPDVRPIATLDDMTMPQAIALGYPDWLALSPAQRRRRLDAQRHAYEQASVCCFTSWWSARSAIEDHGVPVDKVRVVGVGANHIVAPPADRDWSAPRLLFVGWDWERKNGPAVLRAFAALRESFPEATLDLVGRHAPVRAAGVTDHGILRLNRPPERSRIQALLATATCFVMPSKVEPSALAYVEAMHAGLPVIGTRVGGAGNLIGDGGCIVDPTSDDALLHAMATFADPQRAARTGAAATQRAQCFTWPAVGARLLRALGQPVTGELPPEIDQCFSPEIS